MIAQPPTLLSRFLRLAGHLIVILGLERVYEASRGFIPRQYDVAMQNGLSVVHLEQHLHIFDEWHVQAVVLRNVHVLLGPLVIDRTWLISLINHFYLYSHFLGTLAFIIWLYLFRRAYFPFVRNVFFITFGLGLVIYIVFPMMPPRLMGTHLHLPHGYHFIDTLAPLLNYKLQQTQIGYNPYAAMPSMHFAWALILGVTLVLVGRHPVLRLVGLLYPVMMLATIVISGNHFWLDAAGSVVVVSVAALLALWWERRPRRRRGAAAGLARAA